MSEIVVIVGATGGQGGSVARALLDTKRYHVKGVTRNVKSDKAKAIASEGVELINADLNDENSLVLAFQGATAVFAVTDFFEPFSLSGPEVAMEVEYQQGINMAKAAAKTPTLKHYIWSTLANASKISKGKYLIPHFEAKNKVDDFIKQNPVLSAKTTFLWVTYFASNLKFPLFTPNNLKSAGKYVWLQPTPATTPVVSVGNQYKNVGPIVAAILARPDLTLPAKFVRAEVETLTHGELLDKWSRATGLKAEYVEISLDEFDRLWPQWGLEMGVMLKFWEEYQGLSWSGEAGVVSSSELGVKGLVGVEDAFKEIQW